MIVSYERQGPACCWYCWSDAIGVGFRMLLASPQNDFYRGTIQCMVILESKLVVNN